MVVASYIDSSRDSSSLTDSLQLSIMASRRFRHSPVHKVSGSVVDAQPRLVVRAVIAVVHASPPPQTVLSAV